MQKRLLPFAILAALASQAPSAVADGIPLASIAAPKSQALEIDVPSLDGLQPKSAALTFAFRAAGQPWADAKRDGVTLAIAAGGRIIAEQPLSHDRWSYEINLPTPPSGAKLRAAIIGQNGSCVAGFADLLDLQSSRLDLAMSPQDLRLDAIPALLGPAFPADHPLTIWSAFGLNGKERLTAAARAAEAFAISNPKRLPRIHVAKLTAGQGTAPLTGVATDRFKGPLDIVIATAEDLDGLADETTLREITGPYLGISNIGPNRNLLIVSGKTRADLLIATGALINREFVWPQARAAVLANDGHDQAIPPLPGTVWGPDHATASATTYLFKDLGFDTRNGATTIKIPVVELAGGSEINPNQTIEIRPKFIYAPGFLPGASWQAFLDDRFVGSIPLSPNGGDTASEKISVRVGDLKRGAGILELVPVLPEPSGSCLDNNEIVASTLRGDSTITAPWIGGGRIRASLSAWSVTGHLNPAAATKPVRMVIESTEDGTAAAALSIVARMAKAAGAAIPDLTVATDNENALNADLVMVGTHAWAASILKPGVKENAAPAEFPDWLKDFINRGEQVLSAGDGREQVLRKLAADKEGATRTTVFGWSLREGQSVVVAAFPDEARIASEAERLTSDETWDNLAGDFLTLNTSGPATVMAVADPDSTAASDDPDPLHRFHAWIMDAARTAPARLGIVIFGVLATLGIALVILSSKSRVRLAERKGE